MPKHTGWGACYESFVRVAHRRPIVRARSVKEALARGPATDDAVRPAAAHAAEGTNPSSDLNGEAAYRSHLATVLVRQAVLAAAGQG